MVRLITLIRASINLHAFKARDRSVKFGVGIYPGNVSSHMFGYRFHQ